MTLEQLMALGMSKEQAEAALKLHEESVTGLKKNTQDILKEKRELQSKMDLVKDLDPQKYLEMQNRIKEIEQKELEGKNDWATLKEVMTNEHNSKINELNTKYDKAMNHLQKASLNSLKADFIKKGANPSTVDGLIALEQSKGNLKFDFNENGPVISFYGKEVKYENDKIHGIDDWLQTPESKNWLAPKGNSGSGYNSFSGGKVPQKPISEWNDDDKINFAKEFGSEKYQELLAKQ